MYCCETNLLRINYNLHSKLTYCRFIFSEYFDEDEVYGHSYDDSYCVSPATGTVEHINKIYQNSGILNTCTSILHLCN